MTDTAWKFLPLAGGVLSMLGAPDPVAGAVAVGENLEYMYRRFKERKGPFASVVAAAAARMRAETQEFSSVGESDESACQAFLQQRLLTADRNAVLGSSLFDFTQFQTALLGTPHDDIDGMGDDARSYLVALVSSIHYIVRELAKRPDIVGDSVVAAIADITKRLDERTTKIEVEALIRRAIESTRLDSPSLFHFGGNRPRPVAATVVRNELRAIDAVFAQGQPAVVCTLVGMRGIGKTQLAASFSEQCEREGWEFVGWISAASKPQAIDDLASMAQTANLVRLDESPEFAARAMLARIANMPGDRLLVFDNVESFDDIEDLIPTNSGIRILLTSVSQYSASGPLIEVQQFSEREAVQYLTESTDNSDDGYASAVARELGNLPLALTQAATTIRLRDYSFEEYLVLLRSSDSLDQALQRRNGDAYPIHVARALRLAYESVLEAIEERRTRETARRILDILSLHSEKGMSRHWLHLMTIPDQQAREAVGVLVRESILTQSENRTISVHRLVGRVLRNVNRDLNRVDEAVDAGLDAFNRALAKARFDLESSNYQEARKMSREVGADLAQLLTQSHSESLWNVKSIATIVFSSMQLAKELKDSFTTIELAAFATQIAALLGENDDLVRLVRNLLATAYLHAGFGEKAIELHEANDRALKLVRPANHPDTFVTSNNLALAFERTHQYDKAIKIYTQILPLMEAHYGPTNSYVLNVWNNLGGAYQVKGHGEEAVVIHKRVLAAREDIFGNFHPETMTSRHNLANALSTAGRTVDALKIYRENLADRERVMGYDHFDAVNSRNSLVGAYREADRISEVYDLSEKAFLIARDSLGIEHPLALVAAGNWALALQERGDFSKALEILSLQYQTCLNVFGPQDYQAIVARNNFAHGQLLVGNAPEAVRMMEENLVYMESSYEISDVELRRARANLEVARASQL